MGFLELYLIYETAGVYEEHWRPLQAVPEVSNLFAVVPNEQMEQALQGWSRPLVNALGPPPKGALLKLPRASRSCANQKGCTFYQPEACGSMLKDLPWCFDPAGFEDDTVRKRVSEIIFMWREGVYVVVVRESEHA
jgi:hypothetical protein